MEGTRVGAVGSTETSAMAGPKTPVFVVLMSFSSVEAAVAVNATVSSFHFMSDSVLRSFSTFQWKRALVLPTFTSMVLSAGPPAGLAER